MTGTAAAIAAYRLPSELTVPPRLDETEFRPLLGACVHHRLLGFLAATVRDGVLELEPGQRDDVERQYLAWLTHAVRVEGLLLEATEALDHASIDSRVLKGVSLAHTIYDDPADRVFADVDLLVPATELTHAAEVLSRALDGQRVQPELRPGFDDRFGKEAMLKVRGLEVDLHRTFVEGAYGLTVKLDDLFSSPPYRFPLGARELDALPMPPRFLHACYAAAFGDWPPRLASLRDVAQLVHREKPILADVLLMAREWQCEPIVARAVNLAWDELALTSTSPIVEWARRFEPTARQRRMVAWHEGPGRAFTSQAAALLVLETMSDRLAYLRAIMFPQRSYLAARGLSEGSHVRRAWRRIVKWG